MLRYSLLLLAVFLFIGNCSSTEETITKEEITQKLPEIDLSTVEYYELAERENGNIKHKQFLAKIHNNITIPESVRDEKIDGKVIVEALISKEGKPYITEVQESVHPVLTQYLIEAIKENRYIPYRVDNTPVNVLTVFSIQFTIME